jgi:hypothetical protein
MGNLRTAEVLVSIRAALCEDWSCADREHRRLLGSWEVGRLWEYLLIRSSSSNASVMVQQL